MALLESTIESSEDYKPSDPSGGRSPTQPGQVRRVHRRERFLRRERGPQAAVSQGRGVQALARPTHEQSNPRTNPRRASYKDSAANMNRPQIQFGVRENTASPRQHASRPLARSRSNTDCRANESPKTPGASSEDHPSAASFRATPQHSATGEEKRSEGSLLTVHEVAKLLRVPVSWVYERTRRHGPEQLPHFKIGKYLRFEERALFEFVQRQHCA